MSFGKDTIVGDSSSSDLEAPASTTGVRKMQLAQGYLYLNAALYLVLGVRATLSPQSTSDRLGYLTMSDSGRSEYLVVYGGLQIGLAIMFFLLARSTGALPLAFRLSIGYYAPIVLYRLITALRHWPVPGSALGTIGVEALLLLAAVWLHLTTSTEGSS